MEGCIFCKIVKGEVPSHKVYEDDEFMAFLDANPKSAGHTLVIPKEHYEDIFDIPEDVLSGLMVRVKKVAEMIGGSDLNLDGLWLRQSNGEAAGQVVFHFHMHIIPAYEAKSEFDETDLEKIARKIS
ncbi:MAG: HIT family protein [Patescibacteria group bacterium]|nr:HIT family protein [Patescibacteria group bacterium]